MHLISLQLKKSQETQQYTIFTHPENVNKLHQINETSLIQNPFDLVQLKMQT